MDELNTGLAADQAPADDQGTSATIEEAPLNQDTSLSPVADTTQAQQAAEETFLDGDGNLDPRKLAPELQPIFKKMQGAYTKRMQAISEIREKASVVDRFYSDPQFAQQTLAQWAYQNGYQLTPANAAQMQQARTQQQGNAPAFLVDAFKQNLQPELHWMAEPLANAMQASMQGMLQPAFQQQQAQVQQAREKDWDRSAEELAGVAPGWEEHEDTMGELFDFMRSPDQYHPVFGSKLQMLYDLATARAATLKQTQQRVAAAGKNRVSSSNRPAGNRPSIEQEISKASTKDAWAKAVQYALSQHKTA